MNNNQLEKILIIAVCLFITIIGFLYNTFQFHKTSSAEEPKNKVNTESIYEESY